MQLFSADATIYFKKIKGFFAHIKLKKPPSKLLRKTQIHFFFLTVWAAQTAQTDEFMFQNAAYRPTVYRTGVADCQLEKWKCKKKRGNQTCRMTKYIDLCQ